MRNWREQNRMEGDWQRRGLPPELAENHCHITPERARHGGQKLWFVNAPYGGSLLRFRGEPTSLLYAIAPLVHQVNQGQISGLAMEDLALLNPVVRSEHFYAELRQRLTDQTLRVIGISTMTAGCPEARRIAAIAKEVNPSTITIFGGPHEDDVADKTATDPRYSDLIDFSVSGDGEFALLTLVQILFENPTATVEDCKAAVLEKNRKFADQLGRASVFFQHKGRSHQLMTTGGPIRLPDLPRMPRELLHESDTRTFSVFKKGGWNVKTAQVMTHRGCYWRCNFCSESASVNERTVESVVEEIEYVRHFRTRNPDLDRQDYDAVFFDDSTFTNHSPRRRRFLHDLFCELRRMGLQWGCQTRLDQMDEDTLRAMKEAGCSYIYTGLESASNELLRAMVKDEDRSKIDQAFADIARVGIRVGVSLVFGATATGSVETTESNETIRETLDFVSRQTERGNIAVVSPNLATYYPGTRMTSHSGQQMDFHNPIVNPGYPWNRFEEGEGFHPRNLTREMAQDVLDQCVQRFGEYIIEQDLYALEDYQYAYRNGALDEQKRGYFDFNHASLAPPLPPVRHAALAADHFRHGSSDDAGRLCEDARRAAAALMGVSPERVENVVLSRNATEAAAFALWLSGVYCMRGRPQVLYTDAENLSIPRAFRFFMDHGNTNGFDPWSSFQDFGARQARALGVDRRETGIDVQQIEVLHKLDALEDEILCHVKPTTRLVVFSHVVRDTGRICDVQALCKAIRKKNPHAAILVDGAQALGALPSVDVEALGCDFYVGAPHKTLGSYPLGLLYLSDAAKAKLGDFSLCDGNGKPLFVVMPGMFSPHLGVPATVPTHLSLPEVVGFLQVVQSLGEHGDIRGNDCRVLDSRRRLLKVEFLQRLSSLLPDAQILSPLQSHSNFIASFRLPGQDNRAVVERLWRENLVFVSYIARTELIRFSFGLSNTVEDVERAVGMLHDVCNDLRSVDAPSVVDRPWGEAAFQVLR